MNSTKMSDTKGYYNFLVNRYIILRIIATEDEKTEVYLVSRLTGNYVLPKGLVIITIIMGIR